MRKNKFGFTLIEMLAVVLIVAILTAVALPQYRRSIRRAEAMEALVNVRTLFDSAKRYKVANSETPVKLKGLDVEFFDASDVESSSFNIGKFQYTLDTTGIQACRLDPNNTTQTKDYCLHFYYKHDTYGKDTLLCEAQAGSALGTWLCDSLSNRKEDSDNIIE